MFYRLEIVSLLLTCALSAVAQYCAVPSVTPSILELQQAGSSYNTSALMQWQVLSTVNKVRAAHNVSAVTWDDVLASIAGNSSCECPDSSLQNPYHSFAAGYPNVEAALQSWYDQEAFYNYSDPHFDHNYADFTLMVWASTAHIGCNVLYCPSGPTLDVNEWSLLCIYSPVGNICEYSDCRDNDTSFRDNVLSPGSGSTTKAKAGAGAVQKLMVKAATTIKHTITSTTVYLSPVTSTTTVTLTDYPTKTTTNTYTETTIIIRPTHKKGAAQANRPMQVYSLLGIVVIGILAGSFW